MSVLRESRDSLVAMLEAFVHDPLISWRLLGARQNQASQQSTSATPVQPAAQSAAQPPAETSARPVVPFVAAMPPTMERTPIPPRVPSPVPEETTTSGDGNRLIPLDPPQQQQPPPTPQLRPVNPGKQHIRSDRLAPQRAFGNPSSTAAAPHANGVNNIAGNSDHNSTAVGGGRGALQVVPGAAGPSSSSNEVGAKYSDPYADDFNAYAERGSSGGGSGLALHPIRSHRSSSLSRPLNLGGMTPLQPVPEIGRGRRESEGDSDGADHDEHGEQRGAKELSQARGGTVGDNGREYVGEQGREHQDEDVKWVGRQATHTSRVEPRQENDMDNRNQEMGLPPRHTRGDIDSDTFDSIDQSEEKEEEDEGEEEDLEELRPCQSMSAVRPTPSAAMDMRRPRSSSMSIQGEEAARGGGMGVVGSVGVNAGEGAGEGEGKTEAEEDEEEEMLAVAAAAAAAARPGSLIRPNNSLLHQNSSFCPSMYPKILALSNRSLGGTFSTRFVQVSLVGGLVSVGPCDCFIFVALTLFKCFRCTGNSSSLLSLFLRRKGFI